MVRGERLWHDISEVVPALMHDLWLHHGGSRDFVHRHVPSRRSEHAAADSGRRALPCNALAPQYRWC